MVIFKKSVLRSAILGLLALLAICYALTNIVGVSLYDVYLLLGISILLVIGLALCGLILAALLQLLRSARNRRDK